MNNSYFRIIYFFGVMYCAAILSMEELRSEIIEKYYNDTRNQLMTEVTGRKSEIKERLKALPFDGTQDPVRCYHPGCSFAPKLFGTKGAKFFFVHVSDRVDLLRKHLKIVHEKTPNVPVKKRRVGAIDILEYTKMREEIAHLKRVVSSLKATIDELCMSVRAQQLPVVYEKCLHDESDIASVDGMATSDQGLWATEFGEPL